jgi:hypothetical protein
LLLAAVALAVVPDMMQKKMDEILINTIILAALAAVAELSEAA